MKKSKNSPAKSIQKWFQESVTFEDEPYIIDLEQATAIVDDSKNTVVAARAGSGKTRTIVAKIVYLVAKKHLKPNDIMVFVFNANAAKEINARLTKMKVNGKTVINDVKIASTFHAFSRQVVYNWCGGKEKCKEILAEQKESYLSMIINQMFKENTWKSKIKSFLLGETSDGTLENMWQEPDYLKAELDKLSKLMTQFVNRAQQKYLGSGTSLNENVKEYLNAHLPKIREKLFIEIGTECYNRYHQCLLNHKHLLLNDFNKYGTDFNLIVSWASQLIKTKRGQTISHLNHKKYLLIDEYQDFSQLFLFAVFAIRSIATDAKLFVVGDDLQAINRFAGSEVEYFNSFEKYFGQDSQRLTISTNYRCGYEIIHAAHKFMKKALHDKGNFRAFSRYPGSITLVNLKTVEIEYAKTDYDKRANKTDKQLKTIATKILSHSPKITTLKYIKIIVEIIKKNHSASDILILHRNNEMNVETLTLVQLENGLKDALKTLKIMDPDEFDQKIRIMTMHKAKGLEAEVVIILEADPGVIPRTHPDTELFTVFGETTDIALDDQKRLFYVAITRAKKKLYILHNEPIKNGFLKYLGKGLDGWQ